MYITDAKALLDKIISKSRTDMYKPIQIAEVLYHARQGTTSIDPHDPNTYRNQSKKWRDVITKRLTGKHSTSSARYQDDVWNANALPPDALAALIQSNNAGEGCVERYIYLRYAERHGVITAVIAAVVGATPQSFALDEFFAVFEREQSLSRSIDKAYEISVYCLFETFLSSLKAEISVTIPAEKQLLLAQFPDLAEKLLGIILGQVALWQTSFDGSISRSG